MYIRPIDRVKYSWKFIYLYEMMIIIWLFAPPLIFRYHIKLIMKTYQTHFHIWRVWMGSLYYPILIICVEEENMLNSIETTTSEQTVFLCASKVLQVLLFAVNVLNINVQILNNTISTFCANFWTIHLSLVVVPFGLIKYE